MTQNTMSGLSLAARPSPSARPTSPTTPSSAAHIKESRQPISAKPEKNGDFMMAKRVSFFTMVILMISMGLKVNAKENESPVYTQYVAEITSSFLKEVYKKYG